MSVARNAKKRAEQRAFERHCIALPASLSVRGAGVRSGVIRDFCQGGLFLAWADSRTAPQTAELPLELDQPVEIRCTAATRAGEKPLLFRGRVVHRSGLGVGVCFLEQGNDALNTLHDIAAETLLAGFSARHRAAAPREPAEGGRGAVTASTPTLLGRNALDGALAHAPELIRATLGALHKASDDVARRIANDFLERVGPYLLNTADSLKAFDERRSYYDAANLFSKQGPIFKAKLEKETGRRVSQAPVVRLRGSDRQSEPPMETPLSLIDPNEFEDWLAFSAIARCAELRFQESLDGLEQRLEALFNVPIGTQNNPFGPASFCQAFQEALKSLEIDRRVLPAAYAVFKDVLCPSDAAPSTLGTFYEDLNRRLIAKGFLPNLPPPYRRTPVARGTTHAQRAGAAQSVTTAVAHSGGSHGIAGESSGARAISDGSASPSNENWYGVMQTLAGLRRSASSDDTDVAKRAAGPQPSVKTELAAVAARIGDTDDQGQLAEREAGIVDLTGSLFDSMLRDGQVAPSVTPWLRQLSLPVLKLALRDDAVFLDPSHLVRQLINGVAKLEIDSDADHVRHYGTIRRNVGSLLSEISASDDLTPALLERALRHVNALVRLQEQAHAQNVREVLAQCEELQQATPPALHGEGEGAAPDMDPAELREWHARVKRLRPGEWMLIDAVSGPRRLQLAWAGRDLKRFVFVNAKGQKEAMLSDRELALQLELGTAVLLDDANEPLFNRAQYAMLQELHRQLLHETTHDALTGLINRREFERCLERALAAVREFDRPHVVCYVNLNQFAVVNTALGYNGGDQLLIDVAKLLAQALGERGVLARLGGDEFGMLLADASQDDALAIIASQRASILAYRLTFAEKTMSTSFSAGLVAMTADSSSVATLLQAAEASCRLAKCKGKNYVQVYRRDDAELTHDAQIVEWAARMDDVFDKQRLHLRLQPVVHAADPACVHHAEILLGVSDENGVLSSPEEFILAAEQLGRMPAVDRWVIEHVFQWMVDNPQKLEAVGALAINLSGASINEEGFAEFVLQLARRTSVPMDKVCFEVTETVGIANLSTASEFMLAVKELGSTFALDDFGSGSSSYGYLRGLPIDYLKIDGTFVRELDQSPSDEAVVKSVTEIAHFMGKKVIAECVENERVLAMLKDLDVDFVQGYETGRPRPLAEY